MPSPVSVNALRVIDWFLPSGARAPEDARRLRFLIGAALLGVSVAVVSLGIQLALGPTLPGIAIALYGLGLLVVLALVKNGVGLTVLRPATLGLLSAFLCAISLMTTELQWRQLYWLVLIPLASLFLNRTDPTDPRHGVGRLAVPTGAAALAIAMGVLVVALNHAGLTFGLDGSAAPTDEVTQLLDFVLFVLSVSGLLAIHHVALLKAEEDAALLRSMLSVCAWCRKIRDEDQGWMSLERYMSRHTTTQLSHGICPDCAAKSFADIERA